MRVRSPTCSKEIEQYRDREHKLGLDGADWVTVSATPGAPADPAKPEGVYPVIDEFDVTVPTEGFVYDELNVMILNKRLFFGKKKKKKKNDYPHGHAKEDHRRAGVELRD